MVAPTWRPMTFLDQVYASGLLLFSRRCSGRRRLRVSGGITLNGVAQPLLFTWNSPVPVAGDGWAPNEASSDCASWTARLAWRAPRTVGADRRAAWSPRRIPACGAGEVRSADRRDASRYPAGRRYGGRARESLGAPVIPFDSGIVGPQARIPRPGFYEVRAVGRVRARLPLSTGSISAPIRPPATPISIGEPTAAAATGLSRWLPPVFARTLRPGMAHELG